MGCLGLVERARHRQLRSRARLLAPLAFFTGVTLLILIVHNSLDPNRGASPRPSATTPTGTGGSAHTTTAKAKTNRRGAARRFYRVRPGDTLDSIATRYDTTVDDLLNLNPRVDPNALVPGQRIRVR